MPATVEARVDRSSEDRSSCWMEDEDPIHLVCCEISYPAWHRQVYNPAGSARQIWSHGFLDGVQGESKCGRREGWTAVIPIGLPVVVSTWCALVWRCIRESTSFVLVKTMKRDFWTTKTSILHWRSHESSSHQLAVARLAVLLILAMRTFRLRHTWWSSTRIDRLWTLPFHPLPVRWFNVLVCSSFFGILGLIFTCPQEYFLPPD